MSRTCHQCGNEYKRISQHWSLSDCSEPQLSEKKLEIIKGLLMGDATLANRNKTPYVQCTMTNRKYLEHLSSIFKASSDITKNKTAKQSAEEDRKSGFNPKAEKSNYKDVYRWATTTRKELKEFSTWYTSEGKKFPQNLSLSPLCLKHWYVCDGGLVYNDKSAIGISLVNERDGKQKINNFFKSAELPEPSHYNESARRCKAIWTKKDSRKLFDYMGKAIPGFKYKFRGV